MAPGIACCSPASWPRTICSSSRPRVLRSRLADVAEFAREVGEPDPWVLAARYAADDAARHLRHRRPHHPGRPSHPMIGCAWRRSWRGLPAEVFTADDALGWVYQFWQTKRKDEVNNKGRQDRWRRPRPGHPAVHRALHGPLPARELARRLVGRPPSGQPAAA